MIPSAFENVKRLSDAQLQSAVAAARQGDMTAIQALNLTSATPILAEMMRREQMREMFQKNMSPSMPGPQTVLDKLLAQADSSRGIGELEVPGMMEEESYAGGGIVSFAQGESVQGDPGLQEYPQDFQSMPETPVTDEQWLKMTPQQRSLFAQREIRKEAAERRAALGERPSELGSEEADKLFKQRQEALAAITKPYMDRMRAIVEQNRVNEPQRKEELERAAYNEGFASMIGAPRRTSSRLGSLAQNIGAAVRGGMGSYNKGIAQLEEAKRLHARADLDAVKAEAEFAKGNFSEARKYVDDMIESRRNAARVYAQAERDITNQEKSGIASAVQQSRAELMAEQQAEATRQREAAAELRYRQEIEKERMRGARTGGGANTIKPNQYASLVQREYTKSLDNRDRVKEAKELAVKNKQVTPDGKPDPTAVQKILRAKARELVDTDLAARGVAIPEEQPDTSGKGAPEPNRGGASSPPKDQIVGGLDSSAKLTLFGK